jgi:MFS family permease
MAGTPPSAMSDGALPEAAHTTIPAFIKRNTLYLAATQACVGAGNQMVPTLGALLLVHLTGTEVLAGAATGILGGSRLLSAYPTGYVTDAYGRRAGLVMGLLLCLLGTVIIGLAVLQHSLWGFLSGIVVFGLGVGATQQLRLAAADMYPPTRRAEGLGYVLTGSLIGAMGAPVLIVAAQATGPDAGIDPFALTWFLLPVILIPSVALVFLVRPDPKQIAAHLERYYPGLAPPATRSQEARAGGGLASYVRYYPRLVAFVTSFAAWGNMTMMMAMSALALAHHGHALTAISFSVALHTMGMYGLSLPLGHLTDRSGRRNILLGGTVVGTVGGVLVALGADYWVITVGTFLVGLGWSCSNVAASALIADTTSPEERGRAIGSSDTLNGASSIAMPLLAGPLVALAGLGSLAIVSVALAVGPLVLLLRLRETSPGRYVD